MMSEMTFKEAYGVLQKHSEALRQQREPNIDELLTIVEESVAAYKRCKDRIAAVDAALARALGDVAAEAGAQPGSSQDHQRP